MNSGSTIFAQLIRLLPQREFRRCVEKYGGAKKGQQFSSWDQFLCMVFAQLTYRESLRDIEACLRAVGVKLYHLGIRGHVSRTNLARANATTDWRIFADFGQVVIRKAQEVARNEAFTVELANAVYALDSTVLETCLTLFPWTYFTERESRGGVKVHTLLDLKRNIPSFIDITRRKVGDVEILDKLSIEPEAFYIMDRAYIDWKRLYRFTKNNAFFVTRAKKSTALRRVRSQAVDIATGVRSDQIVRLATKNFSRRRHYPTRLRRIVFLDLEHKRRLVFVTNNFSLPAHIIADLYKSRWFIELFFKWLKQHLRIEKFYGNSPNAVKAQIWIAITTYTLVAIAKERWRLPHSLYTILQVLSISLLEKKPILQAFSAQDFKCNDDTPDNQLKLFERNVGQ
jgi:hypothetical protein